MNDQTVGGGIIDAAAVVLVIAHVSRTGHKSGSVDVIVARDNATHIGCCISKGEILDGSNAIFDAADVKFLTFGKTTEWC